jgi:putative acetyltransferase
MARAHPSLALRPMLPADGPLLAEIFRASIEGLTGEDYSATQQEAWASASDDAEAFGARLAKLLTLIGTMDGSPVGFAALKEPGHIDMLFVHPAASGRGVAAMLVDALEKLAAARGAKALTADVSDTAHEFFRKQGFTATQRNTVMVGGEWLSNTTMEKQLGKGGAA